MSEVRGDDGLRLTMIRCSTLLLQWRGLVVLTDPWFAMHLRGLPCLRRPALRPEQLPPLDLLLVSHLHPDHFDQDAISTLRRPPRRAFFPPGAFACLGARRWGWQELAPWCSSSVGPLEVTAVPGPHTLPGPEEVNYVLRLPGWGSLFFGGDARFEHDVLQEIGQRLGPIRLALLPVGGTRILGRQTVMGPRQALKAAELLGAQRVVPIHEGGIWMSVPPLSLHPGRGRQLARLFRRCGEAERALLLREGESARF